MRDIKLLRDMETPMVLGYELDRRTLTPIRRPVRSFPTVALPVPPPVKPIEFPMAKNVNFYRSLLAISSGTLASLTGVRDYTSLDQIHEAFANYYLCNQDGVYETWHDVWTAFAPTRIDN